jgi:hypothetical protein
MVEKAKIIPYDKNLKEDLKNAIEVMFNPNEYTVSVEAKYTDKEDKIQFQETGIPEFRVSLFYDTYETRSDVRKETNKIIGLMKPTVSSGEGTKHPPDCMFVWGKFWYRGVITSAQQRFTMFLENGIPVRSILDVAFTSRELEKKVDSLKGLGVGLDDRRKLWKLKSGDRLDLVASKILGDPRQWRKIAKANRINNPLGFTRNNNIGRILIIPD